MASASTNDPSARRNLGPFGVLRRIAIGGMAEVFLAVAPDGTRVVLKRPLPELATDRSYREALEHEADITRRLRHPHLVQTLGTSFDGDQFSLVLEYVDGTTLDMLLSRLRETGERLSPGTALRIAVDLLDALSYAHAAMDAEGRALELVHRDVGPCNLLVARSGTVKLTDFGIARSHAPRARTRTGAVKGTLRYLAPEQATSSAIDVRTDLYAVGLVLFELLCGEPYLRGDTDVELLRAAEDPPPRRLPKELAIAPAVERALASALARFPEERPASAAAFRKALLPFASDEATSAAELASWVAACAPERPEPAVQANEVAVPDRRRAPRLALLALSVASIAGVATWAAWQRGTEPTTNATPAIANSVRHANPRPDAPALLDEPPASSPSDHEPPALAAPANGTRPPRNRARTQLDPAHAGPSAEPTSVEDRATAATAPSPTATRESVRSKLARADAALRAARARGADVRVPAGLSGSALEAYAEGRYEDADRMLDRILASVANAPSGTE